MLLTPAQLEHYSLIFELNDHSGLGHLRVAELAAFLDSLGHGVPVAELEKMIVDVGVDEDADGSITKDGKAHSLNDYAAKFAYSRTKGSYIEPQNAYGLSR